MLPDLAGEGGLSTFPAVLGTMAEPSRLVPVGPPGPAGSEPGIGPGQSGFMVGWRTPSRWTSPAGRHLLLPHMDLVAS